jgi:hypothetical protein
MHRNVIVVAIVGLFAALIVPAAIAGQPTIQRFPFEDQLVTQSCGFPVQIDATGTVVDISYTDALGTFHEFQAGPTAKATLTNLVTGKSIVVNNSGPGDLTFPAAGGFTQVGRGLWLWSQLNPATLEPGIFLSSGRFVLSRSASGVRTLTLTGTTTDLCARLA